MMRKGFTLIELLVVVLIFGVLFSAILVVLTSSNNSWRAGRGKIVEQQEARRAMDEMIRLLRQTNSNWIIGGSSYSLAISDSNKRIDFYNPVFSSGGAISTFNKITFKLDPVNPRRLLKKEGTANSVVIGSEVEDINFSVSNGLVTIQLITKKENNFSLTSQVALRNKNVTVTGTPAVEQPLEGEF
ncbi:MAG: type II secretion system GspH family protein [Candidatus Omnitrophica bacterium]|jgi:prepilin-type N-terminal cleavage/methylation domain-containing protein|nr:type II secretion system GspH family protein [Candidatus Omnitrophota bacterium]